MKLPDQFRHRPEKALARFRIKPIVRDSIPEILPLAASSSGLDQAAANFQACLMGRITCILGRLVTQDEGSEPLPAFPTPTIRVTTPLMILHIKEVAAPPREAVLKFIRQAVYILTAASVLTEINGEPSRGRSDPLPRRDR